MRPEYVISTSTHLRGFEYGYNTATDTFTYGGLPVRDDFMLRYRLRPYLQMPSQGQRAHRRSSVAHLALENHDG